MILISEISRELSLPEQYLMNIAKKASYSYKVYNIPKRGGGERTIHHPSKELKAVQRWLNSNVIPKLPIHDAAAAYRYGLSIKNNAIRHVKNNYLLRLDLEDFFPTITSTDINNYIISHKPIFKDWSDYDKTFFIHIVCRHNRLTIGAPTSPSLSNAICFDLDVQLAGLSQREEVTYSRYADDLFFSTKEKDILWDFPKKVEDILEKLVIPANLKMNLSKTRHSSKRRRRRVTGIILGSDETISLGRVLKRHIRSQIYQYDSLERKEKLKLAGLIAYAQGIDPDIINSLILKYGAVRIEEVRYFR